MISVRENYKLPASNSGYDLFDSADEFIATFGNVVEAEIVANAINHVDALADALEECLLQIEYLHGKFKETGSGNSALSSGQAALKAYRGEA